MPAREFIILEVLKVEAIVARLVAAVVTVWDRHRIEPIGMEGKQNY